MKFFESVQLTTLDDCSDGLFYQQKLRPYGMHYWYFKLLDLHSGKVISLVLAKNRTPTKLNNQHFQLADDEYLAVKVDFSVQEIEIFKTPLQLGNHKLETNRLCLKYQDNNILLAFENQNLTFNNILTDSYRAKLLNLYRVYSINMQSGTQYLHLQNVVKQGPLVPWRWLHLFLEDGTYVNFFLTLGFFKKEIWFGNQLWRLEKLEFRKTEILLKGSKNDLYFCLELRKKFTATMVYQPKFSPSWEYNQAEVRVKSFKTNIPELQSIETGLGIMEIAKGICW